MSDFGFNFGCAEEAPPTLSEDPLIAWHKALALYGPPTAFEWCAETHVVKHYVKGHPTKLKFGPHPTMFTVQNRTVRLRHPGHYQLHRDDDVSLPAMLFESRVARGLPVIIMVAPEVVLETLFGPPPNIFEAIA